jgi:hypothetical protein
LRISLVAVQQLSQLLIAASEKDISDVDVRYNRNDSNECLTRATALFLVGIGICMHLMHSLLLAKKSSCEENFISFHDCYRAATDQG